METLNVKTLKQVSGFLMIDSMGNAVLVNTKALPSPKEAFVDGSIRRGLTAKQLDKVVRHYRKTGMMIGEEDLECK